MTSIEWTDRTWSPVIGCTRVSAGCVNCYAERFVHRGLRPEHKGLTVLRNHGPGWTGEVRFLPERLCLPGTWRKPQRVFVNPMSDLFHEALSIPTIARVFAAMAHAKRHTFQVLTKRPKRMREVLSSDLFWTDVDEAWCDLFAAETTSSEHDEVANEFDLRRLPNLWLGVSVEDQAAADERIPVLLDTPAAVRWVSYEPALGPVDFRAPWLRAQHLPDWGRASDGRRGCNTCCNGDRCDNPRHVDRRQCTACGGSGFLPDRGLDWIVVGGESGPGARPFAIEWASRTIAQCRAAGVPVFVKQLGALTVTEERPGLATARDARVRAEALREAAYIADACASAGMSAGDAAERIRAEAERIERGGR